MRLQGKLKENLDIRLKNKFNEFYFIIAFSIKI